MRAPVLLNRKLLFVVSATVLLGAGNIGAQDWGFTNGQPAAGDFNGDGTNDLAIFRPQSGNWYIETIQRNIIADGTNWGYAQCTSVSGDYTGDGASDLAVFDLTNGNWYIRTLPGTVVLWEYNWGFSGCIPVPGDYNGDGTNDLAVWDQNTGNWYIRTLSGSNLAVGANWGFSGCKPVPGDYNGDGRSDLAVFYPTSGAWYIRSLSGQTLVWGLIWGNASALVAPGDYDADGIDDIGVYYPSSGAWWVTKTNGTYLQTNNCGFSGGTPVSGHYLGDPKSDFAVYKQTSAVWCISTTNRRAWSNERTVCLPMPPTSSCHSTYSPWVMHQEGWSAYRMYFGRNENIGGVFRDRIYLTESYSADGKSGWTNTIHLVLRPDDGAYHPGESFLIHDPSVVVVSNGQSWLWHMYYTGTDSGTGYAGRVFHATSTNGVAWTRLGPVTISGCPSNFPLQSVDTNEWGTGNPSILFDAGVFRLYVEASFDRTNGSIHLAEGTNAHDFTYVTNIINTWLMHPEVRKTGPGFSLYASDPTWTCLYEIASTNGRSFSQTAMRTLLRRGPNWDKVVVVTPSALPDEGRLYYAGGSLGGFPTNAYPHTIGVTDFVPQ